MVDRDVPNATNPTNSPRLHMMVSAVPGSDLIAGVTTVSGQGYTVGTTYGGPSPPTNGGCHRYYIIVYLKTNSGGLTATTVNRFNFPQWAMNNSLVKVALNYWQTKNTASTQTTPCVLNFPASPTPTPVPTPAVIPSPVAVPSSTPAALPTSQITTPPPPPPTSVANTPSIPSTSTQSPTSANNPMPAPLVQPAPAIPTSTLQPTVYISVADEAPCASISGFLSMLALLFVTFVSY